MPRFFPHHSTRKPLQLSPQPRSPNPMRIRPRPVCLPGRPRADVDGQRNETNRQTGRPSESRRIAVFLQCHSTTHQPTPGSVRMTYYTNKPPTPTAVGIPPQVGIRNSPLPPSTTIQPRSASTASCASPIDRQLRQIRPSEQREAKNSTRPPIKAKSETQSTVPPSFWLLHLPRLSAMPSDVTIHLPRPGKEGTLLNGLALVSRCRRPHPKNPRTRLGPLSLGGCPWPTSPLLL